MLDKTSAYTVVSDSLAHKANTLSAIQSVIIPMGIRQEFFESSHTNRTATLISVGRLDPDKGFQDVIQTLPHLPPEVCYTIIGEGNAREYLLTLAQELGVADRVSLVGSKSAKEIKCLLDSSRVFVHPSRHEGVGLVVIEAMATGIPVITSDIPQ